MKKDIDKDIKTGDSSGKSASQYRIFRLTHDGPEELDFV